MGFTCWREEAKKEAEKKYMVKICQNEHKPKEMIDAIKDMLDDEFKLNRAYYTHAQPYECYGATQDKMRGESEENDIIDEGRSPLLKKFQAQLSVTQVEICKWSRMSWIEDLDTGEVILWVKSQPEKNIELLTLVMVDGFNQTEVAEMWGVSDAAVSKRMKKIKASLEKVLPEGLKKKYIG